MRVGLKLRPGQRGTKKLLAEYGNRLLCVRYRYDREHGRRLKTVELVIEEAPWRPRPREPRPQEIVAVLVEWGETDLARRIRNAGGIWSRAKGLWEIPYRLAVALGVKDRIVTSFPPERDASLHPAHGQNPENPPPPRR